MKLTFQGEFVPTVDPDGIYEVADTQLIHRYSLVNGVVVDKYPGKTDKEVIEADYATAKAENIAAMEAWEEKVAELEAAGKNLGTDIQGPQPLPALVIPDWAKDL